MYKCFRKAMPLSLRFTKEEPLLNNNLNEQLERFAAGEMIHAYEFLGCHRAVKDGEDGYVFRVWAPHAAAVSVVGDFNFWNTEELSMQKLGHGVWEVFSRYAKEGGAYKYYITTRDGRHIYKADPYGFRCTPLPDTSSMIYELSGYSWSDARYFAAQNRKNLLQSPMNIYELHFGSWRRKPDGSVYGYGELADELVPYLKDMGYTHVELLPLAEYPYEPSWGYQVTGYYAPTFRYGEPKGLMEFVDKCHKGGIGVILDWVPAHFPKDAQGLYEFDGECLYELSDPMMNEHPDWGTRIFDYGKGEVQSFLISNAVYWLKEYHLDGLRVDAVASMLYLDYNRPQYKPNRYGGHENLEAIDFLRKLNRAAFTVRKMPIMAAEESTAFPLITKPDFDGGLGFLFKWNMGWMNDMLQYMKLDPLYRKGCHNNLTFSMTYAFSENFILPLSHDEVVHGKCSMINKMPGEYDDKFCNLRTFYAYMIAHPGKKLSFMGNEFAQFIEWRYDQGLDWLLLDYERHRQMQSFVRELNHFYLDNPAFWRDDQSWDGFQWINPDDRDNSIISFRRRCKRGTEILVVCNFCPVTRTHYRMGLPRLGCYEPVLNTDDARFGGYGIAAKAVEAEKVPMHGYRYSAEFIVPPMSVTFYRRKPAKAKK